MSGPSGTTPGEVEGPDCAEQLSSPNAYSLFFNAYLFLREREREREGTEREEDTESEAAPGSELSTESPMEGSNSRTVRS